MLYVECLNKWSAPGHHTYNAEVVRVNQNGPIMPKPAILPELEGVLYPNIHKKMPGFFTECEQELAGQSSSVELGPHSGMG